MFARFAFQICNFIKASEAKILGYSLKKLYINDFQLILNKMHLKLRVLNYKKFSTIT